jgi:hypothetical protein
MPRIELLIKRYGAAALRGDISAAKALLKIRADFDRHPAIEPFVFQLSARDAVVL